MTGWQKLALVAVAVVAGWGGFALYGRISASPEEELPSDSQVVAVRRGNLTVTVTSSGSLSLPQRARLSFGVAGTVAEVLVTEGDQVREGQPLARLEASSFERALVQAQANLRQAEDNLDKAVVQSPTAIPQAEQAVASARVAVQAAEEALEAAQEPYTEEDRADAETDLAAAQISWELASQEIDTTRRTWDTKLQQAEDSLASALDTYLNKVKLYYGLELTEDQAYQDPAQVLTEPDPAVTYAWQNLFYNPPSQETIDDQIQATWRALINARNTRDSQRLQAEKAIAAAEQAERQAQASLTKAQETLDDIQAGPDPLQVALKEAQLSVAQANLRSALDDLEKAEQGPDPVVIETKQAKVSTAQEALDTAQENLAAATLVAPFSGVVNSVSVEAGDRVGANAEVVELVDPSQVEVQAILDEIDLFQVQPGQRVAITLDALPNARLLGEVSFVSLTSTKQGGIVSYPVKVTVTPPRGLVLREGLTATLRIVVEERQGVLLVPPRAIRRQGRVWVAQVMVDGEPQGREVTPGLSTDQGTEVLSGLEEGEQVVVSSSATRSATGRVPGGFGGGGFRGGGGLIPRGGFR